jgi:adenylate cyclase
VTLAAPITDEDLEEISGEYLAGIGQELTVLTADLVAYSELMHRDISTGIAVLRKTRTIVTDSIRRRSGQILQTPGDFVLSTFENYGQAFQAAAIAQEKLLEHHLKSPPPGVGHWKIGIAHGKIYAIGSDFFGNAINVASRLQSLAAPGEIYFTDNFEGLILPEKLMVERLGTKKLKNIDQPITIHRGYLADYDAFVKSTGTKFGTPPKLLKRVKKPVLRLEAFSNINKSRKGALFGQGIVEEIRIILSKLSNAMSVTDPVGRQTIQHDYVLSGAVQNRGPYIRINARLVSSADGSTIWSERFECDLNNSFDVQDQISQEIVSALQLHLTDGQEMQLRRRGTISGKAWAAFQLAHDFEKKFTRQGHETAKKLYRDALTLDANYLSAYVALAFCCLDEVRLGWSHGSENSIDEAEELCNGAKRISANHPDVFSLQAFLFYFQDRWAQAEDEMKKAVDLAPYSPEVAGVQGALYDLMGKHEAAVGSYTRALTLSAHAPAWIPSNLGLSCIAVGDIEEAERIYREVLAHHPDYVRAWIGLAVALNRQGRNKEGAEAARSVLLFDPAFTAEEWAQSRPFHSDALSNQFVDDLHAVGIP